MTDKVATPEAETVAAPRAIDPFMKVTVPGGAVDPVRFTMAVSENGAPYVIEPGEATKVVTVGDITSSMVMPDPHAA